MTLVVVGSINADLTVRVARHPSPGETLVGAGGDVSAGGKGANQAVAAALQGADVRFVGAVGEADATDTAAAALKHLRESGVNLDAVASVPGPTGLAVITVSEDGENTIVVVPGANATVDEEYVRSCADSIHGAAAGDATSATADAAAMVLLQGEIPASGFAAAVELAREAGAQVVINLAPVVDVPREALLAADPLIANEHEAGLILEQLAGADAVSDASPAASLAASLDASPAELAERLVAEGFESVVITLGAQGALVATKEDGLVEIPTPRVKPVDTTGAGDAFVGALCAQLLAGASLTDAARHAARVGAYATLSEGAQGSYPTQGASLP